MAWFCRGHPQTYSLRPYVKGPYYLSSSSALMSRRWLNKNAMGRFWPWPLSSLKLTYAHQANNKAPCHSKCSGRQRSWLACHSLNTAHTCKHIFHIPWSVHDHSHQNWDRKDLLWDATNRNGQTIFALQINLCKNLRISSIIRKRKNYWFFLQHTVFSICRFKTNWAYNIKANVNIISGPQMWKRKSRKQPFFV